MGTCHNGHYEIANLYLSSQIKLHQIITKTSVETLENKKTFKQVIRIYLAPQEYFRKLKITLAAILTLFDSVTWAVCCLLLIIISRLQMKITLESLLLSICSRRTWVEAKCSHLKSNCWTKKCLLYIQSVLRLHTGVRSIQKYAVVKSDHTAELPGLRPWIFNMIENLFLEISKHTSFWKLWIGYTSWMPLLTLHDVILNR